MTKQSILVVDDDPSIARVLRNYLEQAGFEVLVAYDGGSALHTLRREKPALLILDLMLPDLDGRDLARIIRADAVLAATPIIMLTARVEDTDKIVGLELGADDYITKPFNAGEVVARVRALIRRSQFGQRAPASVLQVGGLHLNLERRELHVDGNPVELTPTEFNLLHTLLESPGHTFTREELLEKALGYAYEGMGRTLDTHIKNLRQKTERDPKNPEYIQTVYSIGYRLAAEWQTGAA
jgi:two-component system alkaline phosphatase synthesis response regulator PhoP